MGQYSGMWTLSQVSQAVKNQNWTSNFPSPPSVVEYLIVAGGGSGGRESYTSGGGGGGGAGGVLSGHAGITSGASYFVTVGGGGAGITGDTVGNNGSNSVFVAISSGASTGNIVALGGGGGGGGTTAPALGVRDMAGSGGSGGGAGTFTYGSPGSGTSGQGNSGGFGTGGTSAGGGGGAGTAGLNGGPSTDAFGAQGGTGIASAISGTVVTYAGGGGGAGGGSGGGTVAGIGGIGGGGRGDGYSGTAGTSGTTNTGGGGGGKANLGGTGPSGGSGIVIIRYPGTTQFFTGGTLSYANGYMIHTFYANGVLAPTAPTLYANPDYQIARSLRFNTPDTTYLSRAQTTGNTKIATWSGWVKRGGLTPGTYSTIFTAGTVNTDSLIWNSTGDSLRFWLNGAGSADLVTTQQFRDPSAWYHIVVAIDTTQATAADRVKFYVNGVQITSFSTATYPTQNYAFTRLNTSGEDMYLGGIGPSYITSGYMADVNFIDGQALTPSSFGWTNPATGVWAPLDFVGTYGTNGFNLNFSDNSNTTAGTLGADSSGNGNNFTPSGFSVSAGVGNDSLVDTPTLYGTDTGVGGEVRGNYATLNAVSTAITLSNGNLAFTAGATNTSSYSTIGVSSGKWYAEAVWSATGSTAMLGVALQASADIATFPGGTLYSYGYEFSGGKYNNNGSVSYGATWANGDVIGVALDLDAGTITFYKNGTSQGVAFSGLQAGTYFFGVGLYNSTGNINFGQRPFAYTAPSGHKALNTQNLPTPTIGATSATLANKYFDATLYTGTGSTLAVTNSGGFQPDWVWLKNRSNVAYHSIWDAVRGRSAGGLASNDTMAEQASTAGNDFVSFNSNGFSVGPGQNWNVDTSGNTYVGWQWKAGGAGVTNTSGSITSSVSASPASGFSVVTYTGTGANATVGHGLGVAPSMIIIKNRSGVYNWRVWHTALSSTELLFLNTTDSTQTGQTTAWNSTLPSSTVFSLGSSAGVNESAATFVAYCFAPIAGYSAFGTYTGNFSTDGPFVYTGFRPRWLLLKNITTGGAGFNWYMYDTARDTYNVVDRHLFANLTDAEGTGLNLIDILSNGFKLKNSYTSLNANGSIYIYMAFAENPFKYSLAR